MKRWSLIGIVVIMSMVLFSACSSSGRSDGPLDPDRPITVSVWHYYNGNIKDKFDALVTEFNEGRGVELGIVVDAQSQGDVGQLATAVFESATKSIGSQPMPDIFAAYPDNAFRIHDVVDLVHLKTYFTDEELGAYRAEFLEEGRFLTDGQYYILPIAKSSENLYVNGTFWQDFSRVHGFSNADLGTWEGLARVAETYYLETGKGFFGIDANANYMLQAGMQLGNEIFEFSKDGTAKFSMNRETALQIWTYYYTPYIKGHFVKTGRFSSDDAKTGTVMAYTGSTAGASYVPTEVTFSETQIEDFGPLVLPYPVFEKGALFAMQQGAGMCITKSDEAHEYAAAEFLKWFTENDQNIEFSISTGYFPVKNSAINESELLKAAERAQVSNPAIVSSIKSSLIMFDTYTLYNNPPFEGSYEIRNLLETHLFDKVVSDLEELALKVAGGANRDTVIEALTSETAFEVWYEDLKKEAQLVLNP